MSSGSTWNSETIGGSGASSITVSGTGNFYATAAIGSTKLSGTTATFNAGGLVDSDGISVHSAATTGATIVGATGANEISGGAGADDLTGGASADRIGTTGRVELITIANTTATTDTFTATINGITTATSANAGTTTATAATGLAAAINATTATSFATAVADGAVITVTYSQYFGVAGTTAVVVDAAGANNTAAVTVSAAGDNAGSDTISGGVGADTIIGGTGADVMNGGLGNDAFLQISATDTGFVTAAAAISTVALDKITVNAGDTIKLFLQSAGGYDAFTTLVTTGNVQNTVTANTGTNGTVGRTQGVYDATANTFTVGATGANAVLVSYSTTDAGTTADQQIVIVGVTNLTSITDGVITV
jgi:Ca2+-binding RTX toxin-like protein